MARIRVRASSAKHSSVSSETKFWFAAFVSIVLFAGIILAEHQFAKHHNPLAIAPRGRSHGAANAQVTIIEFLDFRSFECLQTRELIRAFYLKQPDEVLIQSRYFPQDEESLFVCQFSQCASQQDKYWEFSNILLSQQVRWANNPDPGATLKSMAADAELDLGILEDCLKSRDTIQAITEDRILGESMFIRSVPSFIVNGKLVVGIKELKNSLEYWQKKLDDE